MSGRRSSRPHSFCHGSSSLPSRPYSQKHIIDCLRSRTGYLLVGRHCSYAHAIVCIPRSSLARSDTFGVPLVTGKTAGLVVYALRTGGAIVVIVWSCHSVVLSRSFLLRQIHAIGWATAWLSSPEDLEDSKPSTPHHQSTLLQTLGHMYCKAIEFSMYLTTRYVVLFSPRYHTASAAQNNSSGRDIS